MRPAEKDRIMVEFRDKQHDILVATSVIEVGIDIPNATVIMIEGADRFGLAQLHQFRGRVGRGEAQSFCLLLGSDDISEAGQQRLQIIEQSSDGFFLAEEDLKMRGPGEFFGTRQSGVPDLRVAGLRDTDLLELAREEANQLFAKQPTLAGYPLLSEKVSQLWNTEGDIS
jgi:ATP-dependent DNA helicase RecG